VNVVILGGSLRCAFWPQCGWRGFLRLGADVETTGRIKSYAHGGVDCGEKPPLWQKAYIRASLPAGLTVRQAGRQAWP
jgi:hypothetical protein